MDINFAKLFYYLCGVGLFLLIGVVYYFVKGKKDAEEELKKKLEEEGKHNTETGEGSGLYTQVPGADDLPNILISDESGIVEGKIHTVPPRVIYTNYPKTEEERVNARRDYVIQMIIAEGGSCDEY